MSGDGKLLESELSPLEFKRLTAACRRDAFSCGNSEIDRWFRRQSLKQHISMRFRVITAHTEGTNSLVGFYALTIRLEKESNLDREHRLFTFSQDGYFATVRLGWIAVQRSMQRKGYGTIIMGAVLRDFYEISVRTGIYAITLTAADRRTAEFYEKLGFVHYGTPVARQPAMLLPSRSVIEIIEKNAC
jgi:GNAT superfamily N-acetyltransferase